MSTAGTTMDEVVASVRRATDIMAEISAAGKEQELGIGQINHAIIEMDAVTQQNAPLVEEASAAAESLQMQAAELSQIVSVFQLSQPPARAPGALILRSAPALPMRQPVAVKSVSIAGKKRANGAETEQWETF